MATSKIREIVPLVHLQQLSDAPDLAVGWMRYRGKSIPVIDLVLLTTDRSCDPKLSTRIVIIEYELTDGRLLLLGLIAEHVVETIRSKPPGTPFSAIKLNDRPHPSATSIMLEETIQWFDPGQMLPAREIANLCVLYPDILETGRQHRIYE